MRILKKVAEIIAIPPNNTKKVIDKLKDTDYFVILDEDYTDGLHFIILEEDQK